MRIRRAWSNYRPLRTTWNITHDDRYLGRVCLFSPRGGFWIGYRWNNSAIALEIGLGCAMITYWGGGKIK